MHPTLFKIPIPDFLRGFLPSEIEVHSYGFFIAIGALAALWVVRKKTMRFNLSLDELSSLFLWVFLAAFVGGKVFFYLEDVEKYINEPSLMLKFGSGGFVFYGSLIFALPTIVLWLRKKKVRVRSFLDVLAYAGPIVHSLGRVGCFMAGCCHGSVCDSPLGVTFSHPNTMAKPAGVPLYPTQLFDIVVNLIILATVYFLAKKQKFDGQLFLVYLIMYAIGRSIVEEFRGDEARGFLFNGLLSHSQFIAILILVVCGVLWYKWNRQKTKKLE